MNFVRLTMDGTNGNDGNRAAINSTQHAGLFGRFTDAKRTNSGYTKETFAGAKKEPVGFSGHRLPLLK